MGNCHHRQSQSTSPPRKEALCPLLPALTSLNPLVPGEREPSSARGWGPRRASFGVRSALGLSGVGGAGRRPPSLCSRELGCRHPARPGLKFSCPRTAAEPPPRTSGGRRRARPQLTSARAQNAASATGGWRGWRKAASLRLLGRQPLEPGERGPCALGCHVLGGSHPAKRGS